MRIPYKINKNTYDTYQPSPASLALVAENERQIVAENFEWDKKLCPSLITLCVEAINSKFATKPLLNELPCQDRDYLLEILDVDLPLELVVPLIEVKMFYYLERTHCIQMSICYRMKFTGKDDMMQSLVLQLPENQNNGVGKVYT